MNEPDGWIFRFGSWIASTVELQRAFGAELDGMRDDPERLGEYITWNFTALYEELGEMSHELPWAPWKKDRGRLRDDARNRAIDEAVDALHFLANILGAIGCTDEELSDAYVAKQAINRARLDSGRSVATPSGSVKKIAGIVNVAGLEEARRDMHYPECPAYGDEWGGCNCARLAEL